ncbi:MAG: cation diffusion facilitator family transporter [Halodesulfurarchaeum sp.]
MSETDGQDDIKLTAIIYTLILLLKLGGYFVTDVTVLLAEALHTLSDIVVSAFLWAASRWAERDPDSSHHFGHQRLRNVAGLVGGTLFITLIAYELFKEGIHGLRHPGGTVSNLPIAVGVVLVSMGLVSIPLIKMYLGSASGGAVKAQFTELINDQFGLTAALLGTIFIYVGYPVADPVATLAVAVLIAINGLRVLRENANVLMGKAPADEELEEIRDIATSVDGILDVKALHAEYVGPETIHVDIRLSMNGDTTISEADDTVETVKSRIHESKPGEKCVIHVEPE